MGFLRFTLRAIYSGFNKISLGDASPEKAGFYDFIA
jgi:hypothetical protein